MAKSLKEIYGLREMAMEVPDKDVAALGSVVKQAILNGELPPEALNWLYKGGAKAAKVEPKAKGKKAAEPQQPATPTPAPAPAAKAKATPPPIPAPRQPVPAKSSKTPGGWASWKAQTDPSAWDALAGKAEPKAKAAPAPSKDDDFPDLPAPRSANVKLNKHGQPQKGADDENPNPDMFAHKKVGRLSRIFGQKPQDAGMAMQPKRGALSRVFGKKQPQFQDNPYEFNPQTDWQGTGDPFATTEPKKYAKPASIPDDESGEDAMATLGATLAQNPAKPKAKEPTGADAMSDLDWDLKRSKGKR